MKLKKLTLVTLLVFAMSTFVIGCSDENEKDSSTTTKEPEVTTQDSTTTKEVENTTEEITTPEETTEYVYKGERIPIEPRFVEYFDGLVLENGDRIYLNEVCSDESNESDSLRGNLGLSLYLSLEMKNEASEFEDKYWLEGMDVPKVPFTDNYCIEYTGVKVKFVFVEEGEVFSYFDIIPIE